MTQSRTRRTSTALAVAGIAVLTMTSCGGADDAAADDAAGAHEDTGQDYPRTIENCGQSVTFDAEPERIILLETAPVTILDGLGLMDRAVARAGAFPEEYYDEELYSRIQSIESLSEELDASGHLMISQEEVVAHDPDLALGQPDGVSREGLAPAGISMLIQELYCPEPTVDASYETLYAEIETYGRSSAQSRRPHELIAELDARVEDVAERAEYEDRTAAVLYPTVGGGSSYAYGSRSMAQPQLEAAGFENVFSDTDERVFEVQIEELVDRDPDVLILLYQGDVDGVEETIVELPGAETMTAVQEEQIHTQLFNFTEPATPLSVDGLEIISERFQGSGTE
ncbi:ABC transporter substrate-binding protein [Nesterenkonia pannonica]|uniref:ABC transporter substrate-binding protein n=1 Tax=Nesterenkonia pannonica TaxID=1548602 RepID=UPI002164DEF5|nr:ABC transporter substrate-binding protein [Nesterenkonia pannonica]